MIRVVNKRAMPRGYSIYIGRPSPLGNPFRIGPDGDRARVVELYRQWIEIKIEDNDPCVVDELRRIKEAGDVNLVCWCSPLPCHGDVIKEIVENMK